MAANMPTKQAITKNTHGPIAQNTSVKLVSDLQTDMQSNICGTPTTETRFKEFKTMKDFDKKYNKDSQHLLAEGGQSNIYTVLSNDKQLRICKIYDISKKQNELQRVITEYSLIKHTDLLRYHNLYFDECNQKAMITLEPLKYTLRQYISEKGTNISEKECQIIILQIMDKLQTIHKNGFIHNDLTPDNIMWDDTAKEWKIIDFGLILSIDDCQKNGYKYYGTRGWTSPEIQPQSLDNKYTFAKDIWCVGLLILYILCETQPFLLNGYEQSVICKEDRFKYMQYFYYNKLLQLPLSKKRLCRNKKGKFTKFMRKQFGNCDGRKKVLKRETFDLSAGESYLKKYLLNLYSTQQISYDLCNLLIHYILRFDPQKRLSLAQIYKHKWFDNVRHL